MNGLREHRNTQCGEKKHSNINQPTKSAKDRLSAVPKRALRKVGNQRTFETGGQRPCCNEGLQQYRHIDNG